MTRSLRQHLPPTEAIGVYQGDTTEIIVPFTQPDSDGVEQPVDLTGATATAQIRDTSGTLLDTFTTTIEGAEGRATLTLSATQTAALPVGVHDSDLQITRGTDVTTYLRLRLQVVADVSA